MKFFMKPGQDIAESSEVAEDPEFDFSTSGNGARHHGRPFETQFSEGFRDLNEADNKLWMLKVDAFFQVHVMRRGAKVKCFEQGQNDTPCQMFTSQKLIANKRTRFECK